jgi:hypothetical protein
MPFIEIIKKEIGENKFIVVSKRDDGKFSVAQQVIVESDGKKMSFFMKNAIIVGKDGLAKIIDALTIALNKE